ncbi:hypothetical protein DVR12_19345 [Chitinophaga silvatica]|uniref:PepSY domain-containing protein n=1 Tax=Chitinophaga silvatica TaxID=2282649 RepID=A0A3E1Y6Z7_9BACT|nr:hypothetical protein [Chitinophaga silvatica]RFS20715.1 hypothetical protein DVR12_19345 [Chitinophaga silvatica]
MKKLMKGLLMVGLGIGLFALAPLSSKAQDQDYDYAMKQKNKEHRHREVRKEKRWVAEMPNMNYSYYYYDYNANPEYYRYRYQYMWPMPSLPVTNNYVPADVVSNIRNTFGASLYSITTMTCSNGQTCYSVDVMRNGMIEEVTVDGSGSTVMP